MEDKQKKEVQLLIEKAAKSEKSDDAMRFSQAACNAANALGTLETIEDIYKK